MVIILGVPIFRIFTVENLWILRTADPVHKDNFWIMRFLQSEFGNTGRMVKHVDLELGCT